MLGWLLPKEVHFFEFFEQHAALIVEGAHKLCSLMENLSASAEMSVSIKEFEHQADEITRQCIEGLHKTFITPIEREDIFKLISRMDDVMDFIHAAADRLFLYRLEHATPCARQLAFVVFKASQGIQETVRALRHLEKYNAIRNLCLKVHQLENEADLILREGLGTLFNVEKDPILIIKWKEIYDHLENAADCCEDVANIIEGIVLEHT